MRTNCKVNLRDIRRMNKKDDPISVNVLVEAKKEYTEQLISLLYTEIYKGFQSIWQNAKYAQQKLAQRETPEELPTQGSLLLEFQERVRMVPKWSDEIISNEYIRIVEATNCEYLDELLTAVFISHVKVLSAVRLSPETSRINIKVPSAKNFIHKCYIEAARKFYENPFLMEDRPDKTSYEQIQRNLRESYSVIQLCIKDAIQKLLPTKDLLTQYLEPAPEPDLTSSITTETQSVIVDRKDTIKELVKRELQAYMSDNGGGDNEETSSHRADRPERNQINSPRLGRLEKISSSPFEHLREREPDLEVAPEERLENVSRGSTTSSEREQEPIEMPKFDEDYTSELKNVTIPTTKQFAEQKQAEHNLLPKINERLKEDTQSNKHTSETLFLSDSEDSD